MSTKALCHRCQKLPLDTLLYGPYGGKLAQTFFLMLQEVWTMRTCQFCLLVKELLTNHYTKQYIDAKLVQGYDQELWLYRDPLDLSFDKYALHEPAEQEMSFCLQIDCYTPNAFRGNPAAFFRREDRRRDDDKTRDWVMPSIFAVKHQFDYAGGDMEGVSIQQPGRLVDTHKVDWAFVKLWDAACSHHGGGSPTHGDQESYSSDPDYRSRMRVIDVERACIIQCPPNAPYVALSYQWGSDQNLKLKKDNIALLETSGFFDTPEGQPARTIADAMTTVRRLGYKYAWVDALCIVVYFSPSYAE
ncbi:hypothetical protein SLS60_011622 [Paraconiothyrium brasiliense]|uniref:Heterokaryon incompatibility domain-containing protein n=1 Tax=Paraconiothyrium brasiliense TaxID=300254 RepID=A0ABR3QIQ0_9PLEO